jgi:hypothetical protein
MASFSTAGRVAPAGQHQITNATAPIISAKQQNATNRTMPNARPTSGSEGWRRVAVFTEVLLGAPTEKV